MTPMNIKIGDIVRLTVTKVSDYACWGAAGDQVGFVHCVDWSAAKPVPDSKLPKIGDQLRVKVFRLVTESQDALPADVTFGGTIIVHFAGSAAHTEQESKG
jgi:hypothetical protein